MRESLSFQVVVDTVDRNTAADEEKNKRHFANRQEFLQILVRIAIAKFMSTDIDQRQAENLNVG